MHCRLPPLRRPTKLALPAFSRPATGTLMTIRQATSLVMPHQGPAPRALFNRHPWAHHLRHLCLVLGQARSLSTYRQLDAASPRMRLTLSSPFRRQRAVSPLQVIPMPIARISAEGLTDTRVARTHTTLLGPQTSSCRFNISWKLRLTTTRNHHRPLARRRTATSQAATSAKRKLARHRNGAPEILQHSVCQQMRMQTRSQFHTRIEANERDIEPGRRVTR